MTPGLTWGQGRIYSVRPKPTSLNTFAKYLFSLITDAIGLVQWTVSVLSSDPICKEDNEYKRVLICFSTQISVLDEHTKVLRVPL